MSYADAPLMATDRSAPPAGGRALWVDAGDGAQLRLALWGAPSCGEALPVLLMPGRTEFIEKYYEVVAELQARGHGVAVIDWRGQGLSHRALPDRQKGHVDDFQTFLDDLDLMIEAATPVLGDGRYLVLGHSMGGHIGLRHCHDRPDKIAGAVLSAPMFRVNLMGVPRGLFHSFVRLMCGLGKSGDYMLGYSALGEKTFQFEGNAVTRDRDRFENDMLFWQTHPDLALGGVTYGWANAAFTSTALTEGRGYLESIKVPVFIASARQDKLVLPDAHERMGAKLPNGQVLKIEESEHEILRERDFIRTEFWSAFDQFITDLR